MFHLSAFYASITNGATDAVVTAVNDQSYNVRNSRYQFPTDRRIFGGFGGGDNITNMKMDSATLLLNGRPSIYPLDTNTAGGSLPGLAWYGPNGPAILATEDFGLLCTRAGAGAADIFGAIWHGSRPMSPFQGPVKTVRGTATCAGAVGTWQISSISLDTPLSSGTYAVTGLAVQGANVLMGRLVFPMQIERPGVLGVTAATDYVLQYWRFGNAGVFGTFLNWNTPQLECLGTGTISTQVVYLDIVRMGS